MLNKNVIIPKNLSKKELIKYFKKYKLLEFISDTNFKKNTISPELNDLYRLHAFVTLNKRISILEYGCGWSTSVLANALNHNRDKFKNKVKNFRFQRPFKITTVENSKKYLNICKKRNQKKFGNIIFHYSKCTMRDFQGIYCSFYDRFAIFNPDFIYIDGPDPMLVNNSKNGFSNKSLCLPPISGDLLKIEPFLLPGTLVVIDGRTSNARFLKNNLQRNWAYFEDFKNDQNILYLDEKPIGKTNLKQIKFYKS